MNTTPSLSTAAASGSVSLAVVVVLQWLLSLIRIDLPADVQTALSTILTAVIHWLMTNPNCLKCLKKTEAPNALNSLSDH